jgi:antitoxin HigA-1
MKKKMRRPTGPGEILRDEFLIPLHINQRELADHIECDVKVINRLVNGHTALTATLALKLAASLNTTPEFWLNAQKAVDIYNAIRAIDSLPKALVA